MDYTHDDRFALLQHEDSSIKQYLVTTTYSYRSDDYISWGYWGSDYHTDTSHTTTAPLQVWIAGVKTPESQIDTYLKQCQLYLYRQCHR